MAMEELAKGLFGGKLLQGAFPHTQEDAYIRKATDEETENPQTPDGNKDRPDAYRRDFNDPDEESPKSEDRDEAGADEESPEESPATAMTPASPEADEQTAEATPEFDTPEMASEEGTPEDMLEDTPEPETPSTPPELAPGTPEQEDARERGRQAVAAARARLQGRDGADAEEEPDEADAEAADAVMPEPEAATPGAEMSDDEEAAPGAGPNLPSEGNTTIGNFLISTIHAGFTVAADRAFGAGKLTQEERIALSNAISEALKTFSSVLDAEHAEIRDREMPSALAVLAH